MRKALILTLLVPVMLFSFPAAAATPVAAAGLNYLTPVVVAGPNDAISFENLDFADHTFTTDDAICKGSNNTQVPCDVYAPAGSSRTIQLNGAGVGEHLFRCTIHSWMRGVLEVTS